MRRKENNYAFIDSQNLNLAIRGLGWKLDFRRFRVYLRENYGVDFYCLVKYFIEQEKLKAVLIPNRLKFSALLKFKMFRSHLRYMNDLEDMLAYKKKRPREDGTSRGDSSVGD